MTDTKQIKAVARERVGKGAARAVRRQGQVPAVIYGAGQPATPVALDFNETKRLIFAGHFLTSIFEIDLDGEKTRVIPRDYQLDPVKDTPVHVDFLRVTKDATISVEVPVHFINQAASPGIKAGGTINIVHHAIELIVPADAIPEAIEVDVTGLEIGASIHLTDVKLPAGARAATNERDFTVATIVAPAKLDTEAAVEAAGAETTAE
ncbi:50S ribosomal protein L25/general stress protein Ctc [Chelatococcus sp. GCM10030263]|uniref:50S ribosomal protein L25/general stress protein Ctc n=1 Tax=Chelatococcus sp. GCM10030263 TaxID=3273387 RepID=UPI003605EABF